QVSDHASNGSGGHVSDRDARAGSTTMNPSSPARVLAPGRDGRGTRCPARNTLHLNRPPPSIRVSARFGRARIALGRGLPSRQVGSTGPAGAHARRTEGPTQTSARFAEVQDAPGQMAAAAGFDPVAEPLDHAGDVPVRNHLPKLAPARLELLANAPVVADQMRREIVEPDLVPAEPAGFRAVEA